MIILVSLERIDQYMRDQKNGTNRNYTYTSGMGLDSDMFDDFTYVTRGHGFRSC